MKNRLIKTLGLVAFWASWPLLWVYLRIGRRTRVLIIAENEVLVVKPWLGTGHWGLPGGGLHKNEDPIAGAIREVHEETGLLLKSGQFQKLGEAVSTERGLSFKYIGFAVNLSQKPVVKHQPIELLDIAWKPIDELTPAIVSGDVTDVLQTYQA